MPYSFIVLIIIALFLALFSLAMLTYGYAILRAMVPFIVFFVSVIIASHFISTTFGNGISTWILAFIPSIVIGLILAVLASEFYDLFVFVIGVSFGWLFVTYIFALIGVSSNIWSSLLSFVGASIVGIYILTRSALDFVEFFIASAIGSTLLVISMFLLITKVNILDISFNLLWVTITTSAFWLLLWIATFIFGVVSQFYSKIYNYQ